MADIGYYQPYESESDTGSERSGPEQSSDESEYWSTEEEEEALITSPVSLLRTAGPAFANQKDALLDSRTNPYASVNAAFAVPERMGNVYNDISVGTTSFNVQARPVESIINIASQDRDYAVYSNPTAFTLHLPRVYKNVTNFDIQQIKFLNAFYYFRNDKYNTFYDYIETGRPHYVSNSNLYEPSGEGTFDQNRINYFVATYAEGPLKLRVNIREGSYNITSLLQELQYQLNTPPLFFYYRDGFNQFAPLFQASGNYGLNFNYAGSYYYDSLLNTFIANPTTAQVIQHYFPSTNAGLDYYDLNRTLNAYFYPVIKEVFLDPTAFPELNLTNPIINDNLQQDETVEMRVIYNFKGLDDPVILAIAEDNRKFLELYRTQHTYLYSPVNEYSFRVDSYSQKVTIYSTSLQKSILSYAQDSLCNAYREQFLSNSLDTAGVQYNSLISCNNKLLSVLTDMKDFVYNQMAYYFAIPFNTYTFEQLADYTTLYNFQNGIGASNVILSNTYWFLDTVIIPASNYNQTSSTKIQYDTYSNTTCNYNIVNTSNSNYTYKNYQIDVNSTYILSNISNVIMQDQGLLDTSSNLNTNPKTRSLDIICDIKPYEYSVYTFKSPCRQTIQIETIPIPHRFRYFSNTQTYGSFLSNYFNTSNYFDNAHPYLSNIQSNLTAISPYMTTSNISVVFDQDSNSAAAAASLYNFYNRYSVFSFTMPDNPTYIGSNHNITANITIQYYYGGVSNSAVYLYADKASYLNDLYIYHRYLQNNSNLLSNLSSNYISSITITESTTSDITFSNIEFQNSTEYYVIFAQSNNDSFQIYNYKPFVWFDAPASTRPVSYDLSGNPLQSTIPFYFQSPESNARMYEFTNVYTNFDYYLIYDYVYNRLPITSNSQYCNNPSCNSFNSQIINGLNVYSSNGITPIGYDSNNVSYDLTDYKGYPLPSDIQTAVSRFDPSNRYVFNYLTPYSSSELGCNAYFDWIQAGGPNIIPNSNTILEPPFLIPYSVDQYGYINNGGIREYKIVHWHDQCHIPPQYYDTTNPIPGQIRIPPAYSDYSNSISSNVKPYIKSLIDTPVGWTFSNTPQQAYDGSPYAGCNNYLTNLEGIAGIGFLPTDGTWDIKSFMFKSALSNYGIDPNTDTTYIGVFDTRSITKYDISEIKLSNALFKLVRRNAGIYYNTGIFTPQTPGGDSNYGSYHIFDIDPESINSNAEGRLTGYTQSYNKAIIDERSYYSLIPFTVDSNITTFTALCGSVVHNPDLTVTGSNSGIATVVSSNGASNSYDGRTVNTNPYYLSGCNAPDYITRTVADVDGKLGIEVSKYQQSLPIVTQPIQVIQSSGGSNVLETLYNWFYPNMKITLEKKTNYYNSITDVNNLLSNPYDSNVYTPEFGRTRSFFYESGTNFSNDIVAVASPSNFYKWGMETSNNYYKADSDSAGYVFGSYIYNITLDAADSNEVRYLAIRGERPTEQFSTMLRIVAPGRVDFGFVAMSNIFNEISNLYYPVSGGTPSAAEKVCNYNPDYAINLSNFDQAFAMSNRYFGGGDVSNFYGVSITTSNNPAVTSNFFVKFMSNFSNYYSIYASNQAIISNIQCNANSTFQVSMYNNLRSLT